MRVTWSYNYTLDWNMKWNIEYWIQPKRDKNMLHSQKRTLLLQNKKKCYEKESFQIKTMLHEKVLKIISELKFLIIF